VSELEQCSWSIPIMTVNRKRPPKPEILNINGKFGIFDHDELDKSIGK